MPWDGTELWMGDLDEAGKLVNKQKIAGGENESICQPQWSQENTIYFISDKTGWWNIYRFINNKIEQVYSMEAEFGLPAWCFGESNYGFDSKGNIVCTFGKDGRSNLATINLETKQMSKPLPLPYTDIRHVIVNDQKVYFVGGQPTKPTEIVEFDLSNQKTMILHKSSNVTIDEAYLSIPQAISYPTTGDKAVSFAFYYPPKNDDYKIGKTELPPLLVKSHGGPTACCTSSFNLKTQYWTSRGFAVLDVNYRGSTGFGRKYRDLLKNNWGVHDMDDCVNGAKFLIEKQLVDKNRCVITGGSAGGYTVLCALTFRDLFNAGASHYGVSDLEGLVNDTHKFESRYLDTIIGPYPERKDLYVQRSPINYVDRLSKPIIFFFSR